LNIKGWKEIISAKTIGFRILTAGGSMKSAICFLLLMSLVIAAPTAAFAGTSSGSLRCDGGVVSVGDIVSDLLRKCGQPAYASQREEKIVTESDFPGDRIIITVPIDDWFFNFGPNRFQCRILLRNGRVWRIETLDSYGY
jgi:hypothetical protein